MKNNKEHKTALPELRFPEFRDAPEWEFKSLKEVSVDLIDGDWIESKDQSESGIRIIQTGNIGIGAFIPKMSNARYISEETFKKLKCTEIFAGDCLISRLPDPIGRSCFIPNIGQRMVTAVDCLIVRFDKTKIVPYLFILHSQTSSYLAEIKAKSSGSTRERISRENISKIQLPLSKIPNEQKKIADCFSSLDDLISSVADKIEALKEHKKGLMQQLFPAEGSTVPTLRFPEFQSAPEWKETTIGAEMHYENGKAHENDIDKDGEYIVVNSKFISTDGEVIKYTNTPNCLADKGDILMVLSDVPNGRAIAKCFIVDADNKYTVNQRICKLTTKKSVGAFLYYIVNRNPYLLSFDDGVKQTNLKKEDVLKCSFMLPRDPKEQKKIADFLTTIDNLIIAQNDRLNQLKAHKKGLMQRLFPKL